MPLFYISCVAGTLQHIYIHPDSEQWICGSYKVFSHVGFEATTLVRLFWALDRCILFSSYSSRLPIIAHCGDLNLLSCVDVMLFKYSSDHSAAPHEWNKVIWVKQLGVNIVNDQLHHYFLYIDIYYYLFARQNLTNYTWISPFVCIIYCWQASI